MIATGIYLKTLREEQRFTRSEIAAASGTNEIQIVRIEKGEIDTRGSLLLKFVRAVKGSVEHVSQLMLADDLTEEDGRKLALQWLSKEDQDHFTDLAARAKASGKLAELISIIEQLESDPEALDRLAGYSQSLLDSRQHAK